MSAPKEGDLRVWWIPQVPMKPFTVSVDSVKSAKLVLETLADYDIFQLDNNIKPDFSNAGGLTIFEDDEWSDWHSEDGLSIDEVDADGKEIDQ